MPELVRDVLLGLSFFVVGVSLYMCWRHLVRIVTLRHRWDLWFLLIYAGLAVCIGLIAELVWNAPAVPLSWRAAAFGLGLASIGIGTIGAAYSVGRHDKRATDRED